MQFGVNRRGQRRGDQARRSPQVSRSPVGQGMVKGGARAKWFDEVSQRKEQHQEGERGS